MNGMAARDKMFAIFDEPTGRTVAVVWVCHVVYFVFGVKTIRK